MLNINNPLVITTSTRLTIKSQVTKYLPLLFPYLTALTAGGILPFAFAPFDYWPLAFISPIALLSLWHKASAKKAFYLGAVFGLGFFGIGISWVFISIHRFGNTHFAIAALITFLLIVICAIYIALQGFLLKKIYKSSNYYLYLIGFPCSWVLIEWFRGWLFTGFPWLYLAYSQINSPLAAFAPVVGVYGISLAITLMASCCFALYQIYHNKQVAKKNPIYYTLIPIIILLCIATLSYLLKNIRWTIPISEPRTVSIIQGNIGPLDKFTRPDPIADTDKIYGKLTETALKSSLILWPESAIPLPYPYCKDYLKKLNKWAAAHSTTIITGMQFINPTGEYFNSLIVLGNGRGIYHKQHLVPFGDFLPFESWLRGLINFFDLPMSSFTAGKKNQELISDGLIKLNPLICFEIAFPQLVRNTLRDANVIITLSEDGWFGESIGPHQHLQIAQMRALETGRYVLRSTTSGITAIINERGKIVRKIPQFEATVLTGTFQSMTGETPWVKMGQWPLLMILCILFFTPYYIKPRYW